MVQPDRTPPLLPMDPCIALEQLVAAIKAVDRKIGWRGTITYNLEPWCDAVREHLHDLGVILAYRENIVRLAEAPENRKEWPVRAVDVLDKKPVSTADLRRHVLYPG